MPQAAAGPPLLLSLSWTLAIAAARAFAQFADPKVLHFPASPAACGEGQSRSVALLCCRVSGTGRTRELGSSQDQTEDPPQLLWPLRHALVLTPSGNWLSSSKDQVLLLFLLLLPPPQLPAKRELIYIYIFIYLLFFFWVCAGMGLCSVPGGLMWLLQVGCVPSSPGTGPEALPLAPGCHLPAPPPPPQFCQLLLM